MVVLLVVAAGLGLAWPAYQRHHAVSSLAIQIPRGWQYGPAPERFAADLKVLQVHTGMEMKTTLNTPDGHAVAAVFVRPLTLGEAATAAVVVAALADAMTITRCEPVMLALDESFAYCIATDEGSKAATAILVPTRLDRYFVVFAKSQDSEQQASTLVKDLVMQSRVLD